MNELYDNELETKKGELVLWSDTVEDSVFTFINTETLRGKALAAKAFSPAEVSKKEFEQSVFALENLLVHEVQLKDEKTGQKNSCIRTVLFDENGRTAAFVSEGVLGSVKRFVALFGSPPWIPSLPVRLVESSTRMGYRVYSLSVIPELLKDE